MRAFDLIVIGAGSGNSILDERFAGQRVALIDAGLRFGGTCLNSGCIPTKMYVLPADYLTSPGAASRVGVHVAQPSSDWKRVRDRIFGRTDAVSQGGEKWRADADNITLYRERARFIGPKTLSVGGDEITAPNIVIAAGSRPVIPQVPGLRDALSLGLAHTSDTVMRIDALPRRITILGTGYIGVEFAHIFAAFGAEVTMIGRSARVLRREDADISERFTTMIGERVDLLLEHQVTGMTSHGDTLVVATRGRDGERDVETDLLLVAVGRTPNGEELDACAAGVELDDAGFVVVDDQQRTSVPGIWALGDVCSPQLLKHVANSEARIVQHNLLFPDKPVRRDRRPVPHAIFSHPQVAAVGLTEAEARDAGLDVGVGVQKYADTAYGWAMADANSFAKVIVDRASGTLVGAHILGPQAATLIQPLIQAMTFGLDANTMARGQYWIHPALTEVIENALLRAGEAK